MRAFAILIILAITTLPSASFGKLVKGSRAYVEAERELVTAKKQLMQDQAETADFAALLAEMDELRMPRALLHDFWPVNTDLRRAMVREYEQAKLRLKTATGHQAAVKSVRTQEAAMSTGVDVEAKGSTGSAAGSATMTAADRAERMRSILRETDGLQDALANGDHEVAGRYRFLLGEFLQLMRDDVEETSQQIQAREEQLNGDTR